MDAWWMIRSWVRAWELKTGRDEMIAEDLAIVLQNEGDIGTLGDVLSDLFKYLYHTEPRATPF